MSKNIVICSDGTGQSYAGTDSNVLRLYTLASKKAPQQITCYDPGIGTLPLPTGRTRLGRWIRHLEELSFGVGLIDNLVELYAYLMRHYTPGDRIYLFGFSRGAFTARALAGMLHVCGLLRPDDEHLLQYAAGIYQTSEHRIRLHRRSHGLPVHQKTPRGAPIDHAIVDDDARRFKSRLAQNCTVAFMGIWDTVKAYGWIWPRSACRCAPAVLTARTILSAFSHARPRSAPHAGSDRSSCTSQTAKSSDMMTPETVADDEMLGSHSPRPSCRRPRTMWPSGSRSEQSPGRATGTMVSTTI